MVNTENSPPTTPRRLDLFPCQVGDLARVVSSADERMVSLAHLRYISREEKDIEIANNVSTLSPKQGKWVIKKTLRKSDVTDHQTRLLIPKESVIVHILEYLTQDEIRMVEDQGNKGLIINVYDSDTNSTHQLCLKRWISTGSYVLNKNWKNDFVQRRNLKEGDEIGLFWNSYETRLHFCVLPPNL